MNINIYTYTYAYIYKLSRSPSQARMNEMFACSAEGLLAFRLQLLIKVLLLGLAFSFAMPALYLVMAIYGWMAQWIDRICFLRLLLPPPPTHERLMVGYTDMCVCVCVCVCVYIYIYIYIYVDR